MGRTTEASASRLHLELPCVEPETVPRARRAVQAHMRQWGLDDLVQSSALIVSELLANVHRHTDDRWCELTVSVAPRGLRIAVRDHSTALPAPAAHPDLDATGGRGLLLVRCAASRWGVQSRCDGKVVWAEVDDVDDGAACQPWTGEALPARTRVSQ